MKNELKQQARNLFLDTNLSKTEIANRLSVDRRTIRIWSQEGNWENLRRSSRHLPSMVAEKCYYLIDQYTTSLLSAGNSATGFTAKDADAINKMASAIKKIKTRSTVNESMEMFNFFLEDVYRKSPQMAKDISPFIDDYISNRKDVYNADFQLSGFDANGQIPWHVTEDEIKEKWADEKDDELMVQEQAEAAEKEQAEEIARHRADGTLPAESDLQELEQEIEREKEHHYRPLAAPGRPEPAHTGPQPGNEPTKQAAGYKTVNSKQDLLTKTVNQFPDQTTPDDLLPIAIGTND